MKVTVIPVIERSRDLGTIQKNLKKRLDELEICGRIETEQTLLLLRSERILGPENLRKICHLNFTER